MAARPLDGLDLRAVGRALEALGADGWLLFDFHQLNPVASRVLESGGMGTRRLFVWLPRQGRPTAVVHRVEQDSLRNFPGDLRLYSSWRELHIELRALVAGRTLAMEVSPLDAVPYLDRVPSGVVQLVESFGGRVVSSASLVTRFAARWTDDDLAGHRRAAAVLASAAAEALRWAGAETARGAEVRETTVQHRVMETMARAGLVTDHPPIVGFQEHAALPHYEPREGADRRLQAGDVLLLDLWAGPGPGTVFADQTWMAFAGRAPDAEVRKVWDAVRRARDAVVERLRERWPGPASAAGTQGGGVTGAELDDTARGVIRDAGYGEYFVHRTGHSIDRQLHGSGPHLDNFETADTRLLVPGIGFSVEPGIYLPGRFGMRSEINVYLGPEGVEVTPTDPQRDLLLV